MQIYPKYIDKATLVFEKGLHTMKLKWWLYSVYQQIGFLLQWMVCEWMNECTLGKGVWRSGGTKSGGRFFLNIVVSKGATFKLFPSEDKTLLVTGILPLESSPLGFSRRWGTWGYDFWTIMWLISSHLIQFK